MSCSGCRYLRRIWWRSIRGGSERLWSFSAPDVQVGNTFTWLRFICCFSDVAYFMCILCVVRLCVQWFSGSTQLIAFDNEPMSRGVSVRCRLRHIWIWNRPFYSSSWALSRRGPSIKCVVAAVPTAFDISSSRCSSSVQAPHGAIKAVFQQTAQRHIEVIEVSSGKTLQTTKESERIIRIRTHPICTSSAVPRFRLEWQLQHESLGVRGQGVNALICFREEYSSLWSWKRYIVETNHWETYCMWEILGDAILCH